MKQWHDQLNDVVIVEFDDGKRLNVAGKAMRDLGLEGVLRRLGYDLPKERVPVKQAGNTIGSVPSYFMPMLTKSRSYFYQPRPHDFIHRGDHWEAHNTLGPGDLDAIPEFRWESSDYESGRLKRLEDDRLMLRDAMFGTRSNA